MVLQASLNHGVAIQLPMANRFVWSGLSGLNGNKWSFLISNSTNVITSTFVVIVVFVLFRFVILLNKEEETVTGTKRFNDMYIQILNSIIYF